MPNQNGTFDMRRNSPRRGAIVTLIIVTIVAVLALILLGLATDFLVNWLWFSELEYLNVFWTVIVAKGMVFLAVFLATLSVLWANGAIALHSVLPPPPPWTQPSMEFTWGQTAAAPPIATELLRHVLRRRTRVIAGAAGILALIVAWAEVPNWDVFLRLLYQVPQGANDPLYDKDIGFYLFSLPAYIVVKNWLLVTVLLSALLAGSIYWIRGDVEFDGQRPSISPRAIAHGSALLGCYFVAKAWSYVLDRYLLLFGDNGVVVGASYTDIHVELPVLWFLTGLAVVGAFLCWANVRARSYKLPLAAVVIVFATSIVLGEITPALIQRVYVKPNELQLEKPYLQYNIALTQQAYNLHRISVKPFPAEQNLDTRALEANQPTIDNIRLWDWQPLMDTYSQMQEIRTYYKFHDIDVDRYWLDGNYQAVMVSARELRSTLLPANAQTWVNRHLLFTHGNGAVMSPVTKKTPAGLPVFYLRDIPPVASGGPEISEPRIYYGEETDDYVIVKSSTPEFNYPKGKDNVYANYSGVGGIPVGGIARKALFGWYLDDVNILLSKYITGSSRIMIRRTLRERVRMIAPFLRFDDDPYLVASEGRLFWMQDAYTTSSYFPYAQRVAGQDFNYMRNAVKVVIDAYNGGLEFFVADAADPVVATYQRIFPQLFKPLQAMPDDLRKHIRYPQGFFRIQAQMYRAYHMDNPEVFYNREDLWQFPRQAEGGQNATMAPYYIIMRLPGEARAEFFLMLPMAPSQRENMIAWLAARCDPPNYGKLVVYEFPKDKLVYGPFQIEARINQNTEISQQLSLWNQLGSRVIRGNILVIPIENSLLYISPLYLRAEQGQLPELKRVIAVYGDQVVMKETLADALSALFKEPGAAAEGPPAAPGTETDEAGEALNHYHRAIERLRSGDWAGFGMELDKLGGLLERSQQSIH